MIRFLVGLAVVIMVVSVVTPPVHAQGSGIAIEEAQLGRGVMDRAIIDTTSTFMLNDKVYLWMKVTGGSSDSITVTWKNMDHSYATTLGINGSPWRTWAYKTAAWAGEWTVSVTDAAGNVLKELAFTVEGK